VAMVWPRSAADSSPTSPTNSSEDGNSKDRNSDKSPENISDKGSDKSSDKGNDESIPVAELLWKQHVPGVAWNMLAADDRLFVVTEEGTLFCYGAEEREPREHRLEQTDGALGSESILLGTEESGS